MCEQTECEPSNYPTPPPWLRLLCAGPFEDIFDWEMASDGWMLPHESIHSSLCSEFVSVRFRQLNALLCRQALASHTCGRGLNVSITKWLSLIINNNTTEFPMPARIRLCTLLCMHEASAALRFPAIVVHFSFSFSTQCKAHRLMALADIQIPFWSEERRQLDPVV